MKELEFGAFQQGHEDNIITICSFYNPVFVLELKDSQWYSLVQYFLVLSICKLQTPFLRTCLISFVLGAKKFVIYSVYL